MIPVEAKTKANEQHSLIPTLYWVLFLFAATVGYFTFIEFIEYLSLRQTIFGVFIFVILFTSTWLLRLIYILSTPEDEVIPL